MLQRCIAIVLLVAFAMQSFQKNLIVLDYYFNTAIFAENCVNQTRPQLNCKGKCQLVKKLQAEEKKEQQSPENKAQNQLLNIIALLPATLQSSPALAILQTSYPPFKVAALQHLSYPILHPPALF